MDFDYLLIFIFKNAVSFIVIEYGKIKKTLSPCSGYSPFFIS